MYLVVNYYEGNIMAEKMTYQEWLNRKGICIDCKTKGAHLYKVKGLEFEQWGLCAICANEAEELMQQFKDVIFRNRTEEESWQNLCKK